MSKKFNSEYFTSVRVSHINKAELNQLARELSAELNRSVSVDEAIAYLLGLKKLARA